MTGRAVNAWKVAAISLLGGLFIAGFLLAAFPAWPHDAPAGWSYPWNCCSGYDCRMVSSSAIKTGRGGYELPSGEIVPFSSKMIRSSPDGEFHWCSQYGQDDTPTICLFVPQNLF